MSTAPTPPGTAIAPIALTGPSNCIAFTSGTALMTAKESERPNHTQRINLDFIEFSRSCEIDISAPALMNLSCLVFLWNRVEQSKPLYTSLGTLVQDYREIKRI